MTFFSDNVLGQIMAKSAQKTGAICLSGS